MNAADRDNVRDLIVGVRDLAQARVKLINDDDPPWVAYWWDGVVAGYDNLLTTFDGMLDNTPPANVYRPVTTVCEDCCHPVAMHGTEVGCTCVVTLAGGANRTCVCRRTFTHA